LVSRGEVQAAAIRRRYRSTYYQMLSFSPSRTRSSISPAVRQRPCPRRPLCAHTRASRCTRLWAISSSWRSASWSLASYSPKRVSCVSLAAC